MKAHKEAEHNNNCSSCPLSTKPQLCRLVCGGRFEIETTHQLRRMEMVDPFDLIARRLLYIHVNTMGGSVEEPQQIKNITPREVLLSVGGFCGLDSQQAAYECL